MHSPLDTDEARTGPSPKCSAATKQEIVESGVTVASLIFHNVFGEKAQKALTVSVALR